MTWGDPCSRCQTNNYDTFCIQCIIKAVQRFKAIQVKCEQSWNEMNVGDAELHAVLEAIFTLASQGRKDLDETTS